MNVLPGLSLFTLVFICIFTAWLMEAYDFCLSCSGLMGDKFFNLSLMHFGGRIGDLCNRCFDGDFALLRVVRVGAIDSMCVFVWTTTLDLSLFPTELVLGKIQPSVVFSGAPETLANHWLPTGSISPQVFYICCHHWF